MHTCRDGRNVEVEAVIVCLALLANTVDKRIFMLQYSKVHAVALRMSIGSYGVSAAYPLALQSLAFRI